MSVRERYSPRDNSPGLRWKRVLKDFATMLKTAFLLCQLAIDLAKRWIDHEKDHAYPDHRVMAYGIVLLIRCPVCPYSDGRRHVCDEPPGLILLTAAIGLAWLRKDNQTLNFRREISSCELLWLASQGHS